MKAKSNDPKEDPETKARREVDEARAEADRTSATQGLLDRRSRRVFRIFGKNPAAAAGRGFSAAGGSAAGGSGATGIPAGGFDFSGLQLGAGAGGFDRFVY